jgi:hypothetical protein
MKAILHIVLFVVAMFIFTVAFVIDFVWSPKKMKDKFYKNKSSGNVYTCLGVIKHKDEITREWVEHILYIGDEQDALYSRTPEDFNNNFEKVKL